MKQNVFPVMLNGETGVKVRQMVILSGKGGTGKTSVTAAFAHIAHVTGEIRAVLVDADVDASNLELVLDPEVQEEHDFMAGEVAIIDADACEECGICADVCRFDAVYVPETGSYNVNPIACEGCAACFYACPAGAIRMEEQLAGRWFRSRSRYGPLFHAALGAAQENSGRLVTVVRQNARALAMGGGYDLVIIDGPPGIGCPVISASTGVDLALIVTEPTAAGAHDLQRVLATTSHFKIPSLVCINKADLDETGRASIEEFCASEGIEIVGHIPFDTVFTEAMVQGIPITAYDGAGRIADELSAIWKRVLEALAG